MVSSLHETVTDSPNDIGAGDRLFLFDGSGFIFRAYHALPPLSRKSDGLPVGAVSGFCNMLFKLREELKAGDAPTHIAVIFDAGSKTFRNDIYKEYKAHRPPPPEDLVPQFSLCRRAAQAFGLQSIELEGYEADDLIATYAKQAANAGAEVRIYSSDKDLMQLVDSHISLVDPMKNRIIGKEEVFEKFGVYPEYVTHVQALAGDSTDNIPGVPGIGVKTAAQLIHEYGDLESLLENAAKIKQKKRRENLIEFSDNARISYKLVTLDCQAPTNVSLADMSLCDIDKDILVDFLREMEFATLTKRILARMGESAQDIQKASAPVQNDLFAVATVGNVDDTIKQPVYETITDIEMLKIYAAQIEEKGIVAFDTETTGLSIVDDTIVGICLSHTPMTGVYIPVAHKTDEQQCTLSDVLDILKPILEADHILKIGQNIKFDMSFLEQHDIHLKTYDDTMLLSYVVAGGKHRHNMDELSQLYLDHTPISYETICGKGRNKITFDYVALADATPYAAEDADLTLRLWHALKPKVISEKKLSFYEMIERKMPAIVSKMERTGILPDSRALEELSERFGLEMADLQSQIFEIAGVEFNIASPKQMGEVLFDHMGIEVTGKKKKTSSGQAATGADILESLAAEGHVIADLILKWRALQKLKSTYADSLVDHIGKSTGRIHTSLHLTGTATGRFSSSDPNLQNIPVRTEEGRLIRQAFIAKDNHKIISADYSQIELRLLAHIADVKLLQMAFKDGDDIHARTASEVFGVSFDNVTAEMRRNAKAVNFGIIYGISAFGLARQLKIPQSEAKGYIETYFQRLPEIPRYMEEIKSFAQKQGYIETIYGRRIHTKDINVRNYMQRSFAERAAINAPIQGSAADVIKLAMIDAYKLLQNKYSDINMLLQIHDELLFEVPNDQCDAFEKDIKYIMEQAPLKRAQLLVPPVVEVGRGLNWDEAH